MLAETSTKVTARNMEMAAEEVLSIVNNNGIMRSNFIEITTWHGRSPVNLLHIFKTSFSVSASLLFYL